MSKFKPSDWMLVGGGIGFIVFGLFFNNWAKIELFGFSDSEGNAFDWARGWISLLLVVGAAVITVLLIMDKLDRSTAPWPLIRVGLTGLALLLMLLLVITGPDKSGVDLDRGVGLWLSFVVTIVAFAGSLMGFKDAGGDLNDLKDFSKL
ncbi:MAG: hypothetical protein MUE78_12155, partial [Ilumatobacteraceae bacterium]|nr:hypothetical protein [Ilumatobacteraceae bacterium]